MTTRSQRRSPANHGIPEGVQEPMRRRVRMLRQSRGLAKGEIPHLHASTINKIENIDIAALRLGDIYGLAEVFGVSFKDMLMLIAGDDDPAATGDVERMASRVATFLSSMTESERTLTMDIIQRLSRYSLGERAERRMARGYTSTQDAGEQTRQSLRVRLGLDDVG